MVYTTAHPTAQLVFRAVLAIYSRMRWFKTLGWDMLWIVLISIGSVAVWCYAYDCWDLVTWQTPVDLAGDTPMVLAWMRSHQIEDAPLGWPGASRLGAPFGADWSDYPASEDILYWLGGYVARFTTLGFGANTVYALTFPFAAVLFYVAARLGGAVRYASAAFGLAYACCNFHFVRGVHHLCLSAYGHVPLQVFLFYRLFSSESLHTRSMRPKCWLFLFLACGFITGILNIYFTVPFCLALGVATLTSLSKREGPNVREVVAGWVGVLGGIVWGNYEWLISILRKGVNRGPMTRASWETQLYGMRIPDWVMPPLHLEFNWMPKIATRYYQSVPFLGEADSSYLGVLGIVSLSTLIFYSLFRLFRGGLKAVPWSFWIVITIFILSSTGGLISSWNLLTGKALIRGTNRYVIYIFAVSLLFVLWHFRSIWKRYSLYGALAAGLIAFVSVIEASTFYRSYEEHHTSKHQVLQKQKVLSVLSRNFQMTRVFQLPYVPFPDGGRLAKSEQYQSFWPYLLGRNIAYSFGVIRGRWETDWAGHMASAIGAETIVALEEAGFAAILIDRSGYADQGGKVLEALSRVGRPAGWCDDTHCIVPLRASAAPTLPKASSCYALTCDGNTMHHTGTCEYRDSQKGLVMFAPLGSKGLLLFGQYQHLQQGDYSVEYDLDVRNGMVSGLLGYIEVAENGKLIQRRFLIDRSRSKLSITFRAGDPESQYEYRVYSTGRSEITLKKLVLCRR